MTASPQQAHETESESRDVFEAALADHPTRILEVRRIVDMLHITNAPDIVDQYRSAMRRGDRFPPISLVRLCGIWFVADGHKRLTAYRAFGAERVLVEVWPLHRWLRDQLEQGRATVRRFATAFSGRESSRARWRELLAIEMAHVRRILVSAFSLRRSRRPR